MRQPPTAIVVLFGATLLAAGCASGPASAPGAAAGPGVATPKPATAATVNANQAMRPVVAAFHDDGDGGEARRPRSLEPHA